MIRTLFIWSMLLFSLHACKSEDDMKNIPVDILKPEKMTEILSQAHIAEAYIRNKGSAREDSLSKAAVDYYHHIMKNAETDIQQFEKSMDYYMERPELFDRIYQKVLERLSEEEGRSRE
jgi:hypothetical protein